MSIGFKSRFMAQSVAERRELILNGKPLKALLALSAPTLLMAFVQSMIPLTDGLFLNRSAGLIVASAVGFCQPILSLLTAISQGIAVATTAILGQLNGKGDLKAVRYHASQIMIFSFGLGILLTPFCILLAYILSRNVNPELSAAVFNYLSLYTAVLPLLFLAAVYNAIKNATGQPEATLYRIIILLACKLLFNAVFLTWLQMGVYGAVLASFCSYSILGLWMYHDLFIKPSETQLSFRGYRLDKACIRELLRIGIPSILSSAMISVGFFLINLEVESYGPIVLNAQSIASNLNALCFTLPSAITTTVSTMVAMNISIDQERKARQLVWQACGISLVISFLMLAIFYPGAQFFVGLFTDKNEVIEISVRALNIYTFSIFGFAIFMVAQGALIGLGQTKVTLLAGFARIWLFRYGFIVTSRLFFDLGVDSIFWASLLSNVLAGILLIAWLMSRPFKSNLVITQEQES